MTATNGNSAASATWLTGLTFSALAVPLALFGAQPLDVSLGNTNIRGKFDDYAMQYLGAAAILSFGLGASRLGKASKGSQEAVASSSLMLASASSVESLTNSSRSESSLLTESSLRASGLDAFLDEDDAPLVFDPSLFGESSADAEMPLSISEELFQSEMLESTAPYVAPQAPAAPPRDEHSAQPGPTVETLANVVAEVQSIVQQMSVQSNEVAAVTAAPSATLVHQEPSSPAPAVSVEALPLSKHHTAPIFPAAQSYVSFARPQRVAEQSGNRDLTAELAVLDQIYQVREQMQHLMNQVDLIQAELVQTVYPAQRLVPLRAAQAPSYTVSSVEPLRAETAQAADVWTSYRAIA